jgi:tetratricopeptide (TPR) repeat protein
MNQTQPKETARLKKIIADSPDFDGQNRQRLQNALSLGTVRFVREWFMTDPEAGRRAMVFATPDIWTSCGYVAVPEGLAFGGIRPDQKPDLTNLVERSKVFIGRVLPLLLLKHQGSRYVAALSEALRMKIGLAANELGVLLEEQGQPEAAYQAYSQASLIDPKNISAVVNGYVLASAQKMESKEISRLGKKIKELTAGRGYKSHEITGILQNYGTIRQQAFYQQQAKMWSSLGAQSVATDKMQKALALSEQTGVKALIENASVYVQSGDSVKAEACYVAALEKDTVNQPALSGMSLLTLSQNKIAETKKWVQKALDAGVDKDTLLYPTITLAILEKDNVRALKLLEEATRKFPTDLRYWTLQAEVLLGQGDVLIVEKSVLPQMQKALKNPDHFLIHAVRGFLLKKKGPAHFSEGRLSLLRALSINAAMPEIWSALFELDLALGKQDFTEADARNLLNIEPDHALANYLMGALLLSRGKLRESEDFLRRSSEKNPTAAAFNDLGENLRRQQKLTEAETFVRQALAIEPGLLPALDTLACVLCDAGKYDEAAQQAVKTVSAQPKRRAFQLTLLRIQVKQGDYEGVQKRLTALEELEAAIPEDLKKEIETLMKNQKKG